MSKKFLNATRCIIKIMKTSGKLVRCDKKTLDDVLHLLLMLVILTVISLILTPDRVVFGLLLFCAYLFCVFLLIRKKLK